MVRISRKQAVALLLAALAFSGARALPAQTFIPDDPPKAPPGCGPRVIVQYTDDAPDFFIVRNRSARGWSLEMLAIDLGPSAGNLIFDTEFSGPGAGTPAGFEPHSSSPVRLVGTAPAQDGGRSMALHFEDFTPGRDFTFFIDMDGLREGGGHTWVMPSDTAGARVLASFRGPSNREDKVDAVFRESGEADSGAGGCV